MKNYKKDIDSIFYGIQDENTELPQSAKNTIAGLSFKEKKSRRVFRFRKWIAAAMSAVVIIPLIIALTLQPWALGTDTQSVTIPDTSYSKGGVNYIALAAYKNVQDNSGGKAKAFSYALFDASTPTHLSEHAPNEVWEDENGNWHVSYPYDFIRIYSAIQFEIEVDFEYGFFAAACGMGSVKVIIADFEAYEGENETNITGGPDEKIIIFIGSEGVYSCLLNGGGEGSLNFSSHKTITGEAIEKDGTYPIRQFDVHSDYTIDYKIAEGDWVFEKRESYAMKSDSLIEVNADTLYSVLELMSIDEFVVTATAESIEDGVINLSGNQTTNLKFALINDRTEILFNGAETTPEQIAAGSILKITYDKYYDIYNPVKAAVSRIEIPA